MIKAASAILLLAAAAGAASGTDVRHAGAPLAKADGRVIGLVTASERGGVVVIRVAASGLAPGRYGIHLHAVGRCEGPAFESAGPHWNPADRQHGRLNPAGHHEGDLPNLEIGRNGAGRLQFRIGGARLSRGAQPLIDADGAALVLHAAADDERTDPSGNSGARIACGVLAR